MKTLTIIIPVYNGEKYLKNCLKSVLLQKHEGMKVLLIDDGSTDSSWEVIKKAVSKYNLYSYPVDIVMQANAGVAAARNRGIEMADTDYVAFADQDDRLREGFAEEFMSCVEETDHDMVIGGFCRINMEKRIIQKRVPTEHEWSKFCFTYPWGRIIRTAFLKENGIRFLKTGIGEDVYFDLLAYSCTKDIVTVSDSLYVWSDNPASVSNSQYTVISEKVNPLYTFDCILRDIKDEDYKKSSLLEYYFIKFTVWYLLTNVRGSRTKDIIEMRSGMFGWLAEHYPDYLKNPHLSPLQPKGDTVPNRLSVWGYMLLYRCGLDKVLLRVLSHRG